MSNVRKSSFWCIRMTRDLLSSAAVLHHTVNDDVRVSWVSTAVQQEWKLPYQSYLTSTAHLNSFTDHTNICLVQHGKWAHRITNKPYWLQWRLVCLLRAASVPSQARTALDTSNTLQQLFSDIPIWFIPLQTVTYPSSNKAQHLAITLIMTNSISIGQTKEINQKN